MATAYKHEGLLIAATIAAGMIASAVIVTVVDRATFNPNDFASAVRGDSDPPNGISGMEVLVDHLTGCQYLKRFLSAPVPRMEAHGQGQRQICRREW